MPQAHRIEHLVGGTDRIHHAVVQNGLDARDQVVRGDRGPGREAGDLLAHVHLRADGLDQRNQQVNPWLQRAPVAAKQLHHVRLLQRHHPNGTELPT
jgi:hypothetical protein